MRLIDADKLYIAFLKAHKDIYAENRYEGRVSGFSTILVERILNKQPTIEAEPVRHGRWVKGVPCICSKCGNPAPEEENNSEHYKCWLSPYCPNCGAKMDGDSYAV